MKKVACLSILLLLVTLTAVAGAQAQDPVAQTRQILSLLREGKFEEITPQFNARMSAALAPQVLGQTWAAMGAQVGAFKSELGTPTSTRTPGGMGVTIELQFERTTLNMMVFFDADNKIEGLQFVPPPPPQPAAAVPLPAGLVEEAFTVGSGDFALPGTLTLPQGTNRIAAVVLVHGSGPNDRDETLGVNKPFRDLAWGLAARGIAVLRYEKRTKAHGQKMAGAFPNLTVREETIDDAVLAVQGLRRHARIDASHVFVLGHSLGAMLAPRIAQQDRTLTGLILLAGNSRPLPELLLEQTEYLASLSSNSAVPQEGIAALRQLANRMMDSELPADTSAGDLMGVPASYWKDLSAYKPAAVAATLTLPMLILQGERDYQVTMKDFEGWREGLKGRSNATLKSYAALNHVFIAGTGKSSPAEYQTPGKVAEVVIDDIAAWVKAH